MEDVVGPLSIAQMMRLIFRNLEAMKKDFKKRYGYEPVKFVTVASCPECGTFPQAFERFRYNDEDLLLDCKCKCGHEWKTKVMK